MASQDDLWGKRSKSYAEVAAPLTRHMAQKALEHHAALWEGATSAPASFLDVAAGPGFFSKLLAERLREKGKQEFAILCTDFSQGMVDMAKASIADAGVSFAVMDGQDLSTVKDASLDGVNCLFGIMFMPEYPKSVAEMRRVLKPGAKATVGTWNRAGMVELADAFGLYLGALLPGEMSEAQKHMEVGKHPEDLIRLFKEAGFADVAVLTEEKDLVIDDVALLYDFLMSSHVQRKSIVTGRAGAKEPSLAAFEAFLTQSPQGAPFKKADGSPGCCAKFICNLTVATA